MTPMTPNDRVNEAHDHVRYGRHCVPAPQTESPPPPCRAQRSRWGSRSHIPWWRERHWRASHSSLPSHSRRTCAVSCRSWTGYFPSLWPLHWAAWGITRTIYTHLGVENRYNRSGLVEIYIGNKLNTIKPFFRGGLIFAYFAENENSTKSPKKNK